MDAAEYKHVVLGLIFLKYISDAFEAKHAASRGSPTHRGGKGDNDGAHPATSSLGCEAGGSSPSADGRCEHNYGTDRRELVAARSRVPDARR
jgi:hypothetical protein